MRRKRLAIIGNGMATCRLLDELERRGAFDRYEVRVFGEERGGAYNRILLSKVLEGHEPDEIVTKPSDWYGTRGIELVEGAVAKRIDPRTKRIETAEHGDFEYDLAVLATGSTPLVPPIRGMTTAEGDLREGVFVYRTIQDCLKMRAFAYPGDSAVVLGGGLLGLEAAKVLSDRGLHVSIVDVAQTLMPAQLDPLGGEMLRRHIEKLGIFLHTALTVEGIVGEAAVEGVVLDNGKVLPADMVVAACGVRPRVDLARASKLPVNRGIIVNDTLATEVPRIYAVGECAEHNGRTYGLVAPAWEQAAVLADVLSGTRPASRYRGSKTYARLKVGGVDVASMGVLEPELESDQVVQVIEERRSAYRKLVLRGNRLLGAMFVGDAAAAASLVQTFDRGDAMPENPLEALCLGGGGGAPRDRTVCNCHKVSESAVKQAIAAGASTVDALGTTTKAGTGCGSCKNELLQLVRKHAGSVPAPAPAKVNGVAAGAASLGAPGAGQGATA